MRTRRYRYSQTGALAAFGMLLAACSGDGGSSSTNRAAGSGATTLTVSLMDTPVSAVENVTEVNVEISALWLKAAGSDAKQLPMNQTPVKVNLLQLTDKTAALLIDSAPIEPGDYEWLAMDVNADFDGKFDSFVTTKSGGQEEIRVPSGRVRLVSGFTVEASQAVQLLLDWDLRKGLVRPPGQPGFFLKPAIRVIDVTELSVLRGTVALTTLNGGTTATLNAAGAMHAMGATVDATGDPNGCLADDANLDVGNAVYVFAGDNVTPDDIDAIDPEPVTVIPVAPNSSGDYVYRTVIAPGTYTIVFTCQAGLDDPDKSDDLKFVAPVTRTITADAEVVVDF
jgi:hypothetical protein